MKLADIKFTPSSSHLVLGDTDCFLVASQNFIRLEPESDKFIEGMKTWELTLKTIEENDDAILVREDYPNHLIILSTLK